MGVAAVWSAPFQIGAQPSLFNYGEMRYSWSGSNAVAIFIMFDTACLWDQATISNYGLISAIAPNAPQTKALYASSWSPDLYNAGTITAEARDSSIGYESWDSNLTITNVVGGVIEIPLTGASLRPLPPPWGDGRICRPDLWPLPAAGRVEIAEPSASPSPTVVVASTIAASSRHPMPTRRPFDGDFLWAREWAISSTTAPCAETMRSGRLDVFRFRRLPRRYLRQE